MDTKAKGKGKGKQAEVQLCPERMAELRAILASRQSCQAKADLNTARLNQLYLELYITTQEAKTAPCKEGWRTVTRSTMRHFNAALLFD